MPSPQNHPLKSHNPDHPLPLWSLLLACIGLLFASCTPDREASRPIRFAFQNRVGSVLPILAVEKGFFAARGLDVRPLRFNNGPACAEAIYAGSADIGTMGDTAALICVSRTANLRMIASHCTGEHRHRLMVQGASPYRTLGDLRGETIGLKKGTSTYGGFLAALAAQGFSPGDFPVVDLSPASQPEALGAGSIAAFAASEPAPSMGETKGGRELMTFGGMGNQYPVMILARTAFLSERGDETKAFMRALVDAEAYLKAHPGETARVMAEATGLPQGVLTSAMARHRYALGLSATTRESLATTARFLKNQGIIAAEPNLQVTCTDAYLP